jgi:hypothetical protein
MHTQYQQQVTSEAENSYVNCTRRTIFGEESEDRPSLELRLDVLPTLKSPRVTELFSIIKSCGGSYLYVR